MRILMINIRYGYVGGPERYLFNVKHLFETKGHQVIPFSIRYPINEPSEFDKYFVSPLSDDESLYFKKQRKDVKSFLKTLERNFYSSEVEANLSRLIDNEQPDFAFVLLYLRKLSPAVLVALDKKKIPFVVRLSDYGMICASHNLFRGNNICELCVGGNIINSVKYKCVHDSYAASLVNYFATKYHLSRKYFELIRHFVAPSQFLIDKMIEAGWDRQKFFHLPTFAFVPEGDSMPRKSNQIIYAGRLEQIKGIHHLLVALRILAEEHRFNIDLKLAGNGDEKYIQGLKTYCMENKLSTVEFMGDLSKTELSRHFKESILSVIPSLCYDNLPNSALESLASGTPIIAPAHGCFPELVVEGETGFLFEPGNPNDLALKICNVLKNAELQIKMSMRSIEFVRKNHSPEAHYELLNSIIKKVILRNKVSAK